MSEAEGEPQKVEEAINEEKQEDTTSVDKAKTDDALPENVDELAKATSKTSVTKKQGSNKSVNTQGVEEQPQQDKPEESPDKHVPTAELKRDSIVSRGSQKKSDKDETTSAHKSPSLEVAEAGEANASKEQIGGEEQMSEEEEDEWQLDEQEDEEFEGEIDEEEQIMEEEEDGEEDNMEDRKKQFDVGQTVDSDLDITTKDDEISEKSDKDDAESMDTHPLDDLTDQQLIDLIYDMEEQSRHLELENMMFINFLKKNDPDTLDNLEELVQLIQKAKEVCEEREENMSVGGSARCSARHSSYGSYVGLNAIAAGRGPKISLSYKTDMCIKAIEEEQASLEAFLARSHRIERNLKSELEEFNIREAEIKEAINIFEFNVVTQGVDKLTQRIPAEKFIRYMEEWLKSAQLQIEKLRLRIATLKVQYKKVSQQLIQRQELGENVHAVDFDQLEIENKHLQQKIEQKNVHTLQLKKMNGGANLVLSTHKKYLQQQQQDFNKLKEEISAKERNIKENELEIEEAQEELEVAYDKYEQCKRLKSMYKVPEVMEYVRLKAHLYDLKKNVKVWTRRKNIQDIALSTCIRELKSLTGSSEVNPAWFEDTVSLDSDQGDSLFDFKV